MNRLFDALFENMGNVTKVCIRYIHSLGIKSWIFGAIIIVICIISFFGYRELRLFLSKRDEIIILVEKNTDIYNASTTKSKTLLLEIRSLLDFSGIEQNKILENITALEAKLPELRALIESIDLDSKQLIFGSFSDANNIYILYNEGLAVKQATIDLLTKFVQYEACVIKNTIQQYTNIASFSVNLNQFADPKSAKTLQEKAQIVDEAQKKIQENITLTEGISSCFTENYLQYLSQSVRADITKDIELYQKYNSATQSISQGLSKNNGQQLKDGSAALLALKDQNPLFFSSEGYKNAIQNPKKIIQEQAAILEKQEKKITDSIKNIKLKYRID
jgi:hypothetical protein